MPNGMCKGGLSEMGSRERNLKNSAEGRSQMLVHGDSHLSLKSTSHLGLNQNKCS